MSRASRRRTAGRRQLDARGNACAGPYCIEPSTRPRRRSTRSPTRRSQLDLLHPPVLVDRAPAARLPPDAVVADRRRRLERQLRQAREARRHYRRCTSSTMTSTTSAAASAICARYRDALCTGRRRRCSRRVDDDVHLNLVGHARRRRRQHRPIPRQGARPRRPPHHPRPRLLHQGARQRPPGG